MQRSVRVRPHEGPVWQTHGARCRLQRLARLLRRVPKMPLNRRRGSSHYAPPAHLRWARHQERAFGTANTLHTLDNLIPFKKVE